jgi:1-acyl-sn-glycerol-3-phosphate acyltransferase
MGSCVYLPYVNIFINVGLMFERLKKLLQGHNIILMSNHQSEADPAIIALLLEMRLPHIAENLVKFACVLSDYTVCSAHL